MHLLTQPRVRHYQAAAVQHVVAQQAIEKASHAAAILGRKQLDFGDRLREPVLAPQGVTATEDELLELYARHEAAIEAGPYRSYRDVLGDSLRSVCAELGLEPADAHVEEFSGSVGAWPAFHDTAPALRCLHERFRLGVITNCDRDLFAGSNRRLGVTFDWVVTAEDARAYKPGLAPFELAFATIEVPRKRILHVAQSLYHDHVPAKQLGLTTAWVDRRQGRPGTGATPPASASPDLTVADMRTLAEMAA